MVLFEQPIAHEIRTFLIGQTGRSFSYKAVGATLHEHRVMGFNRDRYRARLGDGEEIFERAKRAVRDWRMFQLEWVELCWPFARIRPQESVAILVHHYGFYSLSASRVVYVVDEPRRFGFAYGTLPGHLLCGEERFLVEWLPDGSVWYEIFSFSRPGRWLAWLAYPLCRSGQRRFARESARAMLRAMIATQSKAQTGPPLTGVY